jgi:CheY-like chemotaxis protein
MGRREAIRILVVEDDAELCLMYSRRLQADGYEVLVAGDGPNALASASAGLSLVLLDVRMPGMSGVEVLRRLKGDPETARVPVVMLSNETDLHVMGACLTIGALAWWSKVEVLPAELSRRVDELLALMTLPA